MMQPPPPEDDDWPALEDAPASVMPVQLSILDLLDEIAASMGIPGWEYQSGDRVKRCRRRE